MPYRIANPRRRRSVYALLVAGAVAGFVALGIALSNSHDAQQAACQQVNELRIVITSLIQRSERTLPTLSYYRAHPSELAQAERQSAAELSLFHPVRC